MIEVLFGVLVLVFVVPLLALMIHDAWTAEACTLCGIYLPEDHDYETCPRCGNAEV